MRPWTALGGFVMADHRTLANTGDIINAAGPISVLGGGPPSAAAIAAACEVLPLAVDMAALQAAAGVRIARAFGCESGCVTAGSAAGIAIAVAAAMTGTDRARVQQLPDSTGMRSRVLMQRGHNCNFGAEVAQMVRLAGARPTLSGSATHCPPETLRADLTSDTCAGLFVVSHHTAQSGMVDLRTFASMCRDAGVPSIVDAAGEHDPRALFAAGADVVICSAHKNFGALTAGIVAGTRAMIDACLLQDSGIGRPMKVGKEGVAATIAALDEWQRTDLTARYAVWEERARLALEVLDGCPGLRGELARDIASSPLFRTRLHVSGKLSADNLTERLAQGSPSIRVWRLGVPHGYFELDPRHVSDDEMLIICDVIRSICSQS